MSTRSLMVLDTFDNWDKERKELVRVYRHCDGYPTGAGMCYAEAMVKAEEEFETGETAERMKIFGQDGLIRYWPAAFMQHMLTPREDGWSDRITYDIEPHDTEHGDIEYLYRITGPSLAMGEGMKKPIIEIWHLEFGSNTDVSSIVKKHPMFFGTAEELLDKLSKGELK